MQCSGELLLSPRDSLHQDMNFVFVSSHMLQILYQRCSKQWSSCTPLQVPGGQYSNMYAQCHSLGGENWDKVLQMYADVNMWCGDIVKALGYSIHTVLQQLCLCKAY